MDEKHDEPAMQAKQQEPADPPAAGARGASAPAAPFVREEPMEPRAGENRALEEAGYGYGV